MTDSKAPPQALETESAVLGAMMKDADAVTSVTAILTPEHFYKPAHRTVYESILALTQRGEPVDMATVRAELESRGSLDKVGGLTALMDIADVMTSANADAHARVVRDKAGLRAIIALCNETAQKCHNGAGQIEDLWDQIDTKLTNIKQNSTLRKRKQVIAVNMEDVEPEEIDWLWYPFIPKGTVTIIQGKPGIGKSWATLVIATIVSRGDPFPNVSGQFNERRDPATVLLMAGEDMLSKTIRPRLDQSRADLKHIRALTGTQLYYHKPDEEGEILLTDVLLLEEKIIEENASLLIVDPIQAFVSGDTKMNEQNQMRAITKRIGRMADRTNCAVVMIQHERKGGGSPEKRGLGSIDIHAQARSALMIAPDPDDPNPYDPSTFVIAQIKHNLTPPGEARAIGYQLSKLDGFMWTGPKNITIEQLIEEPRFDRESGDKTQEAVEFLQDLLAVDSKMVSEVKSKAERQGIKWRTLRRAKDKLGIEPERIGAIYFWGLPDQKQTPEEPTEFPPIDTIDGELL